MRAFMREMAIVERDLQQDQGDSIDVLGSITLTNPELLRRFSPIPSDSMAVIGQERLQRVSVRHQRCMFCPECVREDLARFDGPEASRPWLRLEWIISHYRSCDRHNVMLVSTPIKDNSWTFFDFANEMREVIPSLHAICRSTSKVPPSPFQDWLTRRLESGRDPGAFLDRMELYAAIDFCEALGLSILSDQHRPINSNTGCHTTRSKVLPATELARAADAGFAFATHGEPEIRKCLGDLMQSKLTVPGPWQLRDTFGRLFALLESTVDNPDYAEARQLLRRFIIEKIPVAAGSIVLGEIVPQQLVHTVTSIAEASGFTGSTIRRILVRKGVLVDQSASSYPNHRTIIKSEVARSLIEDLKSALTTAKVSELTYLHRIEVRQLVKSGILQPIADIEKERDGKLLIAQSTVTSFLEGLYARAEVVSDRSALHIPYLELPRERRLKLIEPLFSGRLWTGLLGGVRDFRSLLLDAQEVDGALSLQRARTGLKKSEAAKMIVGMENGAIPKLISSGHLECFKGFCPKARRMLSLIPRSSVAAFQLTYVSPVEIALSAGHGPHTIVARLSRAGLQPVFDAKTFRATFYLRSQICEFLRTSESAGNPANG